MGLRAVKKAAGSFLLEGAWEGEMFSLLKRSALVIVAAAAFFAAGVQAKLIDFTYDQDSLTTLSLSFADGVFSNNLSGTGYDGFQNVGASTQALNGWGYDGEYILFNSEVTLNSLWFLPANGVFSDIPELKADTVTVSLYDDSSDSPLTSQTWHQSDGAKFLTFNQVSTSKIVFTTTGGMEDGFILGQRAAFFEIDQIQYEGGSGVTPVPEPQTYALLLSGLLVLTYTARRTRRQAPARTVL
ncbi:MAG TPA: PEP-CTERM sorting domain-containing protein [Burkholderiales bacterium]|nr:PEP-CTERM sorting domain-containing protein [Burkholderiales bacterium]